MGQNLSERFASELNGILNCYDRIVITGNVPTWCYAKGMTSYLDLGRQLTCMALKLREMVIIPELALPVTLQA